jgi:glycerophosphoryl diester phosphodiesterase
MYPENTTEGFLASLAQGNRCLEMDVQILSDSALGVMHDTTVDRTTTSTGNVVSFDTAGWQALAIDSDTVNGGNFGNALVPPLFANIVNTLGIKTLLLPEAKVTGSAAAIVTALQDAGIPVDQAMVQSISIPELEDVVAGGYPACYLTANATNLATAVAAGITWVGMPNTASTADIESWIAADVKVLIYTVNRRYVRDSFLALGVSGFFSDDPIYLSTDGPYNTTDNFAAQRWQPGMQATNDAITAVSRGAFISPDKWGFPANGNTFNGCLQGWACPIKGNVNADSFTVDLKVTFGAVNAGDTTRWAGVFFCASDRAFTNVPAAPRSDQQGFHFLFRRNGSIDIFSITTTTTTQRAATTTSAIAEGEEVAFRVQVTPTAVSVHRLDGSGNITHTASYSDSSADLRGGYMHLTRSGMVADFRGVTIT